MMSEQDASQWFIARDGKQTGPIADVEIKAIAAHGYFKPTDLVWKPGFAEWRSALQVFPPGALPVRPAPPPLPAVAPPAPSAAPKREVSGRPIANGRDPSTAPEPMRAAPESLSQRMTRAPQPDTARLPTQPPYGGTGGRPAASTDSPRELQPAREPAPLQAASGPASAPRKTNKVAVAALVMTVATIAGGVWIAAYPGLIKGLPSAAALAGRGPHAEPVADVSTADLEARWLKTAHWPVIKREFPDWYGERLREAATLEGQKKSDAEITQVLVGQMIALRRQNAASALAASATKLKVLAAAFLDNLRQLKGQSTTTCFNFISQGEITPGVVEMLGSSGETSSLQLQVAAIFDAIGEGRKTPVTHEKPQKADYDTLMGELSKLGWTQADVATFSDPNALARAEPARVCQMVQDWFVAHISITDEPTQERLLSETLRPVVSG